MQTHDAIRTRRSTRAFLPTPVPREVLTRVLDVARWAPSGSNRQPWRITVVAGAVRDTLAARLVAQARARHAAQPTPDPVLPPGDTARNDLGGMISAAAEALGVSRWEFVVAGSYRLYNAPVTLVISSPGGGGVDVGSFIATLLLAAHEEGLGACWLGYPLSDPDIFREVLALPEQEKPAGVVALGYPDPASPANAFRSPRLSLETLVRWVGWEE